MIIEPQAGWKGFEDVFQYYYAIEAGCKTLVTKNTEDFAPINITLRDVYTRPVFTR